MNVSLKQQNLIAYALCTEIKAYKKEIEETQAHPKSHHNSHELIAVFNERINACANILARIYNNTLEIVAQSHREDDMSSEVELLDEIAETLDVRASCEECNEHMLHTVQYDIHNEAQIYYLCDVCLTEDNSIAPMSYDE